jgi:hypothetical protein
MGSRKSKYLGETRLLLPFSEKERRGSAQTWLAIE